MPHTILLVDDHPVFRQGLRQLLEKEKDLKVVGEAGDGLEAIERLRELSPDILVMDINMPNLDGIEATKKILEESPDTRVAALSVHSGKRFVRDMLQAGAAGYILKESVPEEMIQGIRTVLSGDVYLSAAISGIVVSEYRKLLSKVGPEADSPPPGADSSHQAAPPPCVGGYHTQGSADRTAGTGASQAHDPYIGPGRLRQKRPCESVAGDMRVPRDLAIAG